MGFLDRIATCTAHDLTLSRPLRIGGQSVGWVRAAFAETLRAFPDVFAISDEQVALVPGLDDPVSRSAAIDGVLRRLRADGLIPHWKDEPYSLRENFSDAPLMTMERAAVSLFGIRAYGVHLNGYRRDADGLKLWIARRADDRVVAPGKLDNMVAGGQPAGLSVIDNLIKEAWEEAAVPEDLARRAVPAGLVSYAMDVPRGLRRDVLFVYDLEVPAGFTPVNTDGETASFELMPVDRVSAIVRDSEDFKFNCNLVILDFLVRHGVIGPEHPEFMDIVAGLRVPQSNIRLPSEPRNTKL